MFKTCLYDIKRLFSGGRSLIVNILAPVLLLLCFAATIGPSYFTGNVSSFVIAINNQDDNELTASLISGLAQNEAARGLVDVTFVESREEGEQLISEGAAALINVPAGFQDELFRGGSVALDIVYNEDMPLEAQMIDGILTSAASLVNTAQRSVNSIYYTLRDNGYGDEAGTAFSQASQKLMADALMRSAAFESETSSPLGAFMPIEYYAMSLVCLFMFLGGLALSSMACSDAAMLPRHLISGRGAPSFALSKLISGGLYLFAIGAPVSAIMISALIFTGHNPGDLLLLTASLAVIALLAASVALLASTLSWKPDTAVKACFALAAILVVAGGLLLPTAFFGPTLSEAAVHTPAGAALRSMSVMFFEPTGDYYLSLVTMGLYTCLFTILSGIRLNRRAVG